jgi:predicted exporter
MSPFKFFSTAYDFLSSHRILLFSATALIVIFSALAFTRIEINEDISAILPEEPPEVVEDFRLLQQAPLSRKIVINLKRDETTDTNDLLKATDRLARAMIPPYFENVISGPPKVSMNDLISFLLKSLPSLATERDLERIHSALEKEKIRAKLTAIRISLASPGAWQIKEWAQNDPLDLRFMAFKKLRHLNTVPKVRLEGNHFISEDGLNSLLIAETPVGMTDSKGSRELLDHFHGLVEKFVPKNIKTTLMSGHRYSAANSETVNKDLIIVLSVSSLAILALFLIYIRSWIMFVVFLVPASVIFISSVGVSLVYRTISAITMGFGSVILGVSVDFAVHVYFALRSGAESPGKTIKEVSRPVIFGGLTSLAAFSVLLFSNLPGQRQLAVFSLTGLGTALILCLVVLPQAIGYSSAEKKFKQPVYKMSYIRSRFILVIWMAIIVLSGWYAMQTSFDGDLRSLNLVTEKIRSDEIMMQRTWGDIKGRAIIFSEGRDMGSALRENDRLYTFLKDNRLALPLTTLAPILPSPDKQKENRGSWNAFWDEKRRTSLREMLETEGSALGFSKGAFDPFLQRLSTRAVPVTPEDLREAGLGEALESMIVRSEDKVRLLTLVPDTKEMIDLMAAFSNETKNIHMVSQARFGDMISKALGDDFIRFIVMASLGVIILLILVFREIKKIVSALIPVVTGLVFMAGVMAFFGMKFNLFNIVATILVIGLGVDYGIFMVCRLTEAYDHHTERAVLVSGLTTLSAFGALVLARHPALHSIGVTVLFGIGAAIPSALFVIPAIYRRSGDSKT